MNLRAFTTKRNPFNFKLPISIVPLTGSLKDRMRPGNFFALVGQELQKRLRTFIGSDILPSNWAEKSRNFHVKAQDDSFTSVAVVSIPNAASRHNSTIRPDLISSSVSSVLSEKPNEVILAVDRDEDILGAVLAISRAMPCAYTRKLKDLQFDLNLSLYTAGVLKESSIQVSSAASRGVRLAQQLTDAAPNDLSTRDFADIVRADAERLGYSIKVIEGEELRENGFGGLWNVGKAAKLSPPVLMHLTWKAEENGDAAVIVGKGIVYDSGGLALKPRDGMAGMKRDMGGAAACFSAFSSIVESLQSGHARLKQPYSSIECILCLAENAIGSEAFKNDDILTLYSGLTVEVNNTDAEGRLVLADGVAYAAKHINDIGIVIDLATLTGAATYAAGHLHGGLLTNDADLEHEAVHAGQVSGDLVHPMLWIPEIFEKRMHSDFADLMNTSSPKDDVPASCAGWFIHKNLEVSGYKGKWMHVDMAKPVTFLKSGRASGYGVGLLTQMLIEW